MGELLKGNAVVKSVTDDLLRRVVMLKERRIMPTLAIVRLGEREDDLYYQRNAVRRCEESGITTEVFALQESITEEQLINEIMNLNLDDHIHGILLLRPLPAHINDDAVCAALDPRKDVDGVTDTSLAGVMKSRPQGFAPCTAEACIEILRHYHIPVQGRNAVVIGRSLVVGKPLSLLLLAMNATVTVCHTKTENLASVASAADILIAAAGRAGMVTADFVRDGAAVIDVGINVASDGKLTGDVDFDNVADRAGYITPVPGGVGPVTTAILARHTVEAAERAAVVGHSNR